MGYKRAEWRSGLTYSQTCEQCKTTVEYGDDKLDFRPWFPDGFIYCPTCRKPLRHSEAYAVTELEGTKVDLRTRDEGAESPEEGFCTQCGKAFRAGDRFCSGCGTKRE